MIVRVVYEFSYELSNKIISLFEALQFVFNIIAMFTHITNSSFLTGLLTYKFEDYDHFYNFNNYILLWNIQIAFIGFGTFFLPFRIL